MAVQWVFRGFDVAVSYTLPAPAGATALKNRVVVADNLPTYREALAEAAQQRAMLGALAESFTDADPYQGWSPFVFGVEVKPDWQKIEVA